MTDFSGLLAALADAGIRFVLVGGLAGVAHGSARVTQDVDVVYARDPENLRRLAAALAPHRPYLVCRSPADERLSSAGTP